MGGSEYGKLVNIDTQSNIYVTGFGVLPGEFAGWLTAKFDASGNLLWDNKFKLNQSWEEYPNFALLGPEDEIYITGNVGVASGGTTYHGLETVRYNSDGSNPWVAEVNQYAGIGKGLALVNDLSLYAVGQFYYSVLKYSQSNPVPVELTSFTNNINGNNVNLNWSTATEINNSGFEIQRLKDSKIQKLLEWEVIGFVNGNGTTTESQSYSFTENNIASGKYLYRLKQIDFDGSFGYSNTVEVEINSPVEFSLEQNYPNPFNPSTVIGYQLAAGSQVTLKIFNSLGQEIETLINEYQNAGAHSTFFIVNSTFSSGVYFYELRVYPVNSGAGSFAATRKMILLR